MIVEVYLNVWRQIALLYVYIYVWKNNKSSCSQHKFFLGGHVLLYVTPPIFVVNGIINLSVGKGLKLTFL